MYNSDANNRKQLSEDWLTKHYAYNRDSLQSDRPVPERQKEKIYILLSFARNIRRGVKWEQYHLMPYPTLGMVICV